MFKNPNLRKHLKENVDIVVTMVIKQLVVMREKQIKKRRTLVVFLTFRTGEKQ